jgi:hypothetical protein
VKVIESLDTRAGVSPGWGKRIRRYPSDPPQLLAVVIVDSLVGLHRIALRRLSTGIWLVESSLGVQRIALDVLRTRTPQVATRNRTANAARMSQ